MSRMISLSRATLVAAVSGLITVNSMAAAAKTPEPPGLFSLLPTTALSTQPSNAVKGKSRAVKIDRKMLRKARFFVRLPGGISYEVVRDIQHEAGNGQFGWIGHAAGDPNSRAVFGVSGDAVAGTLAYDGKLFRLEPRANGSHILSEIKRKDPAPELDPLAVADTAVITPDSAGNIETAGDTGGALIDVLVAYTPSVRTLYGTAGAEALIIQAVAEANQAYANSGMSTRLNLVRSVQTNYVESGDMSTDLSRLRSTSDGYMDDLHSLRNTYRADLVSLIENEPQYCGIAYRMATLSASFASSAFSVVHHSCATGYYSFAHEIGHNQGAHHDANNASGAIYPYAYGYQDPNNGFRTVMAYNCDGGCERISHFSNAEVMYNGAPTGFSGVAENADAIDNTAATVASFRQGVTTVAPANPTGLNAAGVSASHISLKWMDTSNNETGFYVERSFDGIDFSQIASLPANSVSYTDSNLLPDSLLYYRIAAWNSAGRSSYSNVATATTQAMSQYINFFATSETSEGGSVSGTYMDTQSKDGIVESIKEITSGGNPQKRYSYLEHYWAIQVPPGAPLELLVDVATSASNQSFTFAYSTSPGTLSSDAAAWIDMFTVSNWTSGTKRFTLPTTQNGWIYVSVRDNNRTKGVNTSDAVEIDHLAIEMAAPPGC